MAGTPISLGAIYILRSAVMCEVRESYSFYGLRKQINTYTDSFIAFM